ncbi:hypothetical protein [Emticicia sp. 17c]|uniref:hypothetical protein n=1 Tax=Emticicia sp. 17c TaxID=3127704 RepID=UPI00301D6042
MRTILTFICTIVLLSACETANTDPLLLQVNGQWKLIKIGIGFPAPGGPTEIQPTYQETLEFDASNGNFTRIKDGKVVEQTKVSVSSDKKATYNRDMLIFEKSNTYSYISFTETSKYMVLYQSAPVGSTLADGNSFFYEKIK